MRGKLLLIGQQRYSAMYRKERRGREKEGRKERE
jgi:hypothetical protein